MKRIIAVFVVLSALAMCGCAAAPANENEKLTVVATLFPQYDFTRNVTGDLADVTLILPAGVESHSYEPTPADIVNINNADLFIYTGKYMEPWAASIIESLPDTVTVVNASKGITLMAEDHEEEADEAETEIHDYDPHIWTSPVNAAKMTKTIVKALCTADPANSVAYEQNGAAYVQKLNQLDLDMKNMIDGASRRTVCFAGRFAMRYFTERYGLEVIAAYDSCSAETEPSARAVAEITDEISDEGIPVVYYEELTDPQVARSICEQTGCDMLLLHSCHNLSKDELAAGKDYISIMYENLNNLKAGLY